MFYRKNHSESRNDRPQGASGGYWNCSINGSNQSAPDRQWAWRNFCEATRAPSTPSEPCTRIDALIETRVCREALPNQRVNDSPAGSERNPMRLKSVICLGRSTSLAAQWSSHSSNQSGRPWGLLRVVEMDFNLGFCFQILILPICSNRHRRIT